MKISEVRLRNFRNIEDLHWRPAEKLNFLIGGNGEGKTSILEAIAYLSSLRSFRDGSLDELVRHGTDQGMIDASVVWRDPSSADWNTQFKIHFVRHHDSQRWSRQASINGKPYRSSLSYISQRFLTQAAGFHSVIFNPADHDLVRGSPAGRRQYLDRTLASESLNAVKSLQRYRRLLEQRNALLKQQPSPPTEILAGFSEPLAQAAAEVTRLRMNWLLTVFPLVLQHVERIAPLQRKLRVAYLSKWFLKNPEKINKINNLNTGHFAGQSPVPSLDFLETEFSRALRQSREDERRYGATMVGPHRDDWGFFLGETPLQGFGSQGEVRSVLLALKLAELELFQRSTGQLPVFLLDDFSSELDSARREFMLGLLEQTPLQVFVTTTEERFDHGKRFNVLRGELLEWKESK